jgi:hypothetical protein
MRQLCGDSSPNSLSRQCNYIGVKVDNSAGSKDESTHFLLYYELAKYSNKLELFV